MVFQNPIYECLVLYNHLIYWYGPISLPVIHYYLKSLIKNVELNILNQLLSKNVCHLSEQSNILTLHGILSIAFSLQRKISLSLYSLLSPLTPSSVSINTRLLTILYTIFVLKKKKKWNSKENTPSLPFALLPFIT